MPSSIYKDIIDEKIAEWQNGLNELEGQAEKATSDTKAELRAKLEQIRPKIDTAIVQLRNLDEQETVDNTMETKKKMLEIFNTIDKDFPRYEDYTPYML